MDTVQAGTPPAARPCKKCSVRDATLTQRSEPVCRDCYAHYVASKCVRQIGILGKDTRIPGAMPSRRYLVGLSLGTSSTVLLHLLSQYADSLLAKGRPAPFQLFVVHVDTALPDDPGRAQPLLDRLAASYPRAVFERAPLSAAAGLRAVDWPALPAGDDERAPADPAERLRRVFERLPSATARADVLRVLVRHVLVDAALRRGCQAVLLGHSTTALAELTLAEAAKGRGFSLPWQVGDGVLPVRAAPAGPGEDEAEPGAAAGRERSIRLHHPLRELFRKELVTYAELTEPPLAEAIPPMAGRPSQVVSHKDLSIEEVMARYFEGVEESYPSVVANVVRTTAKLNRLDAEGGCGVCGMPLDEHGNERWRGEIGEDREGGAVLPARSRHLCYGCQRSIHN